MYIEQLYTNCLAEAAYYIESNGEAAIVDPLRESDPYIEKASARGARIKYIFETHFHADFVSGHLDLAKKTGADIIFGPQADTDYEVIKAKDGQRFKVGNVTIEVLHTPGHTLESSCYLLYDEHDKPHALFTGDTLFIGDVGRPDLAVDNGHTEEDLAGLLFISLRKKILPLPDDVMVYPAHGPGSACGKSMSKEKFDTLGHQKQVNYALQDISKEQFVKKLTTGILPAPQYFAKNAALNKNGYESLEKVMDHGVHGLSAEEFKAYQNEGALVLDNRKPDEFAHGHIPGSMNIGHNGMFAIWVGTLIEDLRQPILLVTPTGKEAETVKRLARVGYDNTIGYLKGGIEEWKSAGERLASLDKISAESFAEQYEVNHTKVLDVRKPSEFAEGHVQGAMNFPLDFINDHINDLNKEETYWIHCKSGYRSSIAGSILQSHGFNHVINIADGYDALDITDIPKDADSTVHAD